MKTRVRVERAALIKVVEGRTRKAENEYKRAVAAYPSDVEKWQAACVVVLRKALAAAEKGKMPSNLYGNTPGLSFPNKPMKPSEGRSLCDLRRMLATLKMGSEDSILLSQEDADAYFGPCLL